MKKLALKFFLSLCIVLLSGFSLFFAHGLKDYGSFSLGRNIEKQTPFAHNHLDDARVYHSVFSSTEAEDFKLDFTDSEDKDDELLSFAKKVKENNYFSSIFYALTSGYFRHIEDSLSSSEELFYNPTSRRHVIFRVFRI